MATVIFAVVMLHLVVGFGYVLYRLHSSDKSGKDMDHPENTNSL